MSQEKEPIEVEDPKVADDPSRLRVSRSMSWNPRDMKILVVDDEPTARMVCQRVLKKCGYNGWFIFINNVYQQVFFEPFNNNICFTEVEVVESGRKALEILSKPDHGVQLVLCDLHMPDSMESLPNYDTYNQPVNIFNYSVDGIGLVESVRSTENIKGLPIVST